MLFFGWTWAAPVVVDMPVGDSLPSPVDGEHWLGAYQHSSPSLPAGTKPKKPKRTPSPVKLVDNRVEVRSPDNSLQFEAEVNPSSNLHPKVHTPWFFVLQAFGYGLAYWESPTGWTALGSHRGRAHGVTEDGQRVAWVGRLEQHLTVFDSTGSRRDLGRCATHKELVQSLVWSGDGRMVATMTRGVDTVEVQWCDIESGVPMGTRQVPSGSQLGPTPTAVHVVQQLGRRLEVTDHTGATVALITNAPHLGTLRTRSWELGTTGLWLDPATWTPLSEEVNSGFNGIIRVHQDGPIIVSQHTRTYILDARGETVRASVPAINVPQAHKGVSVGASHLMVGGRLWNFEGEVVTDLAISPRAVTAIAPDDTLIVWAEAGTGEVTAVDLAGTVKWRWTPPARVDHLLFAQQGKTLIVGTASNTVLLSRDGTVKETWPIRAYHFSTDGDGRLLVADEGGGRFRYRMRDLEAQRWLWSRTHPFDVAEIDATGRLLTRSTTVVDGKPMTTIDLYNPQNGERTRTLAKVPYKVTWAGESRDGALLIQERFGPLRIGAAKP